MCFHLVSPFEKSWFALWKESHIQAEPITSMFAVETMKQNLSSSSSHITAAIVVEINDSRM
jgi:hypothetical protein